MGCAGSNASWSTLHRCSPNDPPRREPFMIPTARAFTLGNPTSAPRPPAAYSNVARIDLGTVVQLTLAGQLPLDEGGNLVGEGDMAVQTQRVLEIITALLADHGANLGDVVHLRSFLTDIDQLAPHIEVRNALLAEP